MNSTIGLALAFAAGALAGAVFFGGLWLTVRRLGEGGERWLLASLALRFAVVVGCLALLANVGDWRHLLLAAAGMMLSRLILVRRLSAANDADR